jgi:Ca2+-binding RTX toxin-like protein
MPLSDTSGVRDIHVESYRKAGMTDSQVIQAALNAAASTSGGERLILGDRTYALDRTIDLPSDVQIVGGNTTVTWTQGGAAFSFFRIENASNVRVEGLTFQWNTRTASAVTPQTHAIVVESSTAVAIVGSRFFDSKAIHIAASNDVLVSGNGIWRGLEGVVVGMLRPDMPVGMSTDIRIVGNTIEGQIREAIDINSDAEQIVISDNILRGVRSRRTNRETTEELIDIGGNVMRDVAITNNIIDGGSAYIIGIRMKLGVDSVVISNNILRNMLQNANASAIQLEDIDGFDIYGNRIEGSVTGITVHRGGVGGIRENVFAGSAEYDIRLHATGDRVSIADNQATGRISVVLGVGTSSDELLTGDEAGPNRLEGNAGADTLLGGVASDTMGGGVGNDFLVGGHGDDRIAGGDGTDTLFGGVGADTLDGGSGQDVICAGWLDDLVLGGEGDDLLYGGQGADTLDGGGGNDTLIAGGSLGQIDAGGESAGPLPTIAAEPFGQLLHSRLIGGTGNDLFVVDRAGILVIEQAAGGRDTLEASNLGTVTLPDHVEDLRLGAGMQLGFGNSLDNFMFGSADRSVLSGLGGADTLHGGLGDDTLIGGAGADVFILRAGGGRDVVEDFDAREDRIVLWGDSSINAATLRSSASMLPDGIALSIGADSLLLRGITAAQLSILDIFIQ